VDRGPLKRILEAALLAAGGPLSLERLAELFPVDARPDRNELRAALGELMAECQGRGVELTEVASGFRYQVCADLAPWVGGLWEERPARYSRALLETLALIAYRQPITRAEIEEIRGVGVSASILKTLHERDWIRVVGHREVPGRPALYATTRGFLDDFGLKALGDLPPLSALPEPDKVDLELDLPPPPSQALAPLAAAPDALEPESQPSAEPVLPSGAGDELS
jgi:segregation and condensation protein B